MAEHRITLLMRGQDEDNGDVRIGDFIKELAALRRVLSVTNHLVSAVPNPEVVDFTVVDLRHNNPATIVLQPTESNQAAPVLEMFVHVMTSIAKGQAPPGFGYHELQAYRELTSPVGKTLTDMVISVDDVSVPVTARFAPMIDIILGPDEYESGSVQGTLDQINVHAGQRLFTVYPMGRHPKVTCIFPAKLRDRAVHALGRYVEVYGQLKYKTRDRYPYEISVRDIDVFPPAEELPSLQDLRGFAPDATGGQSSEDWVRDLRSEW